jgi:peptidoglycan/xylan/chitin deacetylase (PgdA/CDA1 family)
MTSDSPSAIVKRGPGDQPRFALTFDDGPGDCTERVLESLARRGVRATFFLLGCQVERYPELAREVKAGGHEIGSHSMEHLDHVEVPPERALADMVRGAALLGDALGVEPALYRAPYGRFVPITLAEAARRGWTCVGWSTAARDWHEGKTARSITEHVTDGLTPGAILLFHDSRRWMRSGCDAMLEALENVLEEALRRGLEPVKVTELLRPLSLR